jgi:hypothetical protein
MEGGLFTAVEKLAKIRKIGILGKIGIFCG